MDRLGGLVVMAPARRAGDPGSNPGPGENFSLVNIYKQRAVRMANNSKNGTMLKTHKYKYLNNIQLMKNNV